MRIVSIPGTANSIANALQDAKHIGNRLEQVFPNAWEILDENEEFADAIEAHLEMYGIDRQDWDFQENQS